MRLSDAPFNCISHQLRSRWSKFVSEKRPRLPLLFLFGFDVRAFCCVKLACGTESSLEACRTWTHIELPHTTARLPRQSSHLWSWRAFTLIASVFRECLLTVSDWISFLHYKCWKHHVFLVSNTLESGGHKGKEQCRALFCVSCQMFNPA